MRRIFPPSFYNLTTLIGAAIATISFGLILFLMVLEFFAESQKPYVGIITFVVLPGALSFGILLIIAGIVREHRRERRGKPHGLRLPVVDLNNPRHRTAFFYFSFGGILLLGFSGFGSYKAYEYTDSDEFCGETCHKVMSPEYTAYQFSPHARVGCAKCHIGPGAGWFVRSKLSGAYQVYATLFDLYPRPIPTPIQNLRPAQETCEQCHWPRHFYSQKQRMITNFISDERNTRWNITLLMKIGGGNVEAGPTSGIHWHMNIANEVTYAALDTQRAVIPWIRVRNRDGSVRIYRNTETLVSDAELEAATKRRMDCVDCHNRPTHIYHPPAPSINHVMELGWIDRTLPSIKSIGVEALEKSYSTKATALDSIRGYVENYYRTNYPEVIAKRKGALDNAIEQIQTIYSRNYFPEMKHDWRQYPDHIGHMYSPGCFRCHDGKHVNDEGKVLSKDCNTCHTILAQQYENRPQRFALKGLEYEHPVDIGTAWKEMNCNDCHSAR